MLGVRVFRATRCVPAAAAVLPREVAPTVRKAGVSLPLARVVAPLRPLTTAAIRCAHAPNAQQVETGPLEVTESLANERKVSVVFGDKSSSSFPYVWLRENCQCRACFNKIAIARTFLVEDLDLDIKPKDVQVTDGGLTVEWPDGHVSSFDGPWLHQRAFTQEARERQRSRYMLEKVHWGPEFQVPRVEYRPIMEDDRALLEWILLLERYGVVMLENSSTKKGAINDLINHFAFVKGTHYGTDYELVTNGTPNNLAYTGVKLGLHTDLPYYELPPGTTWLHCIQQHVGEGGANDVTDGLNAAKVLRERHPHHFETLVNTNLYFQDRGFEIYQFDKITKMRTIELDDLGNPNKIHLASQSRDSIMDLDSDGVIAFYHALKAFNHILYELSIRVKTTPGDILVMDNTRVLHGRTYFNDVSSNSTRRIHNAYVDWDELRSTRRVLQDKLNVSIT
ncbi:gamma-butyrobetaine dioxygenase-like [Panulirus ornatus]|uniref:gamma-butyrobetaine dioxygenase-like n=1 Tax=Panulirus ornatus TaxID=150431 RepID=UPI003A887F1A